jgi:hypothetical protein
MTTRTASHQTEICQSIKLGLQRHIHFRLPNASMRRELFALHRVNPKRVEADYAVLAGLSRGLSGGDILNVCVNAIHAGSKVVDSTKWKVTQAMLEPEIAKVKKAKAEHSGEKPGRKRRIGFLQGWWVPTCCHYCHARQTCEVGLFVVRSPHEFHQLSSVPGLTHENPLYRRSMIDSVCLRCASAVADFMGDRSVQREKSGGHRRAATRMQTRCTGGL